MKNTLIVNLFGAPGTGKSTTMAQLFSILKWNNIDCEMASEFAKDLVWEDRQETFKDQIYIFAKQNHRLFRCNGKVDVVICDCSLLLSTVYNRVNGKNDKTFETFVYETFNKYNNMTFFLNRTKEYNPNGRNQTEEESNKLAITIKNTLNEFNIDFIEMDATEDTAKEIAKIIENKLKEVM